MCNTQDVISLLCRNGESKWAQWAKVKHIQEGGRQYQIFPSYCKWAT
jgi:hypothetical protein